MIDPPSFEDAILEFAGFIRSTTGLEGELLWVFRDDLIQMGTRLRLKIPVPESTNRQSVKAMYERNRAAGLGIAFDCLAHVGPRPCCYIDVPADARDAELRMIPSRGLKLCAPKFPPGAEEVTNAVRWLFIRAESAMMPSFTHPPGFAFRRETPGYQGQR